MFRSLIVYCHVMCRTKEYNQKTLQSFHGDLGVQLKVLHGSVVSSVGHQQKQIQQMQDCIKGFTDSKNEVLGLSLGHKSHTNLMINFGQMIEISL